MVSSLLNAVLTLVLVALYGHLLMPEVFGLVALTLSLEPYCGRNSRSWFKHSDRQIVL